MTGGKKRRGAEMKKSIAMTSMLLLVFAAQVFGLAYGAEETAANDSMNITQINETINNTTYINETLDNATFINATLVNVTLINATLENATFINGTFDNTSLDQNESDPFTNAKNRKPSSR
jgi:uncharacterized protein YjbI with pentapeptide repeats